mmetsp:Transcript_26780/g.75199  ORF Transcript_26780/g.75199 Transcript_26780/m.75199 type:complete len:638 (-) Transcript_26780:180-2093(-)
MSGTARPSWGTMMDYEYEYYTDDLDQPPQPMAGLVGATLPTQPSRSARDAKQTASSSPTPFLGMFDQRRPSTAKAQSASKAPASLQSPGAPLGVQGELPDSESDLSMPDLTDDNSHNGLPAKTKPSSTAEASTSSSSPPLCSKAAPPVAEASDKSVGSSDKSLPEGGSSDEYEGRELRLRKAAGLGREEAGGVAITELNEEEEAIAEKRREKNRKRREKRRGKARLERLERERPAQLHRPEEGAQPATVEAGGEAARNESVPRTPGSQEGTAPLQAGSSAGDNRNQSAQDSEQASSDEEEEGEGSTAAGGGFALLRLLTANSLQEADSSAPGSGASTNGNGTPSSQMIEQLQRAMASRQYTELDRAIRAAQTWLISNGTRVQAGQVRSWLQRARSLLPQAQGRPTAPPGGFLLPATGLPVAPQASSSVQPPPPKPTAQPTPALPGFRPTTSAVAPGAFVPPPGVPTTQPGLPTGTPSLPRPPAPHLPYMRQGTFPPAAHPSQPFPSGIQPPPPPPRLPRTTLATSTEQLRAALGIGVVAPSAALPPPAPPRFDTPQPRPAQLPPDLPPALAAFLGKGKPEEERNECIICMDATPHILFLPCQHVITCSVCSNKLFRDQKHPQCPVCRQFIKTAKCLS